jgi:hypothetical protein
MIDPIETSSRPRALMDMCHHRSVEPKTYKWIVGVALKATAAGERVTWGRDSGSLDAAGFRALLREALDIQITNRSAKQTGRKHQPGYQRNLRLDAVLIRSCRERGDDVPLHQLRTPDLWRAIEMKEETQCAAS